MTKLISDKAKGTITISMESQSLLINTRLRMRTFPENVTPRMGQIPEPNQVYREGGLTWSSQPQGTTAIQFISH